MEKQDKWIQLDVLRSVWLDAILLSLLPFCILYFLFRCPVLIVYHCIKYRRDVVRDNLLKSFPEKPLDELIRIEKKFYHFFLRLFCGNFEADFHLEKGNEEADGISRSGASGTGCARGGHNFIFLYLGHYCNWEWVASLPYTISPSIHCAQIYHPLYNKAVDRFFLKLRNQFGGECIPMKNTLRRVIELKREKRPTMIGFISDQLPKWNSMHFFVPFLHREIRCFYRSGAD